MEDQLLTSTRATEIVSAWRKDPIQIWQEQQRATQYWLIYLKSTPKQVSEKYLFARRVQTVVQRHLEYLGFTVNPTTHTCSFDLWVNNVLTVEVKGSKWTRRADRPQYGRYQFDIRPTQKPDIFIVDCVNGSHYMFVIPGSTLKGRRKLEITSEDVNTYTGQWAQYLNAWELVGELVEQAGPRPQQLFLPISHS
jgi:hypothetical protein